jgi:hypothetical protein
VIEILISRRIFCAGRNADGLLATSAAHMHVLSAVTRDVHVYQDWQ